MFEPTARAWRERICHTVDALMDGSEAAVPAFA